MTAFIDGDDLCAGCGKCCHDVTGLRMTEAELERLPLLARWVTRQEGVFRIVDLTGPCPYLTDELRCGVFDERPFDCSLYPVNVRTVTAPVIATTIGRRPPETTVEAHWHYGGAGCPHRLEFVDIARHTDREPLRQWVAEATGADRVVLRTTLAERARAASTVWLKRVGLLDGVRRLLGKGPAAPLG